MAKEEITVVEFLCGDTIRLTFDVYRKKRVACQEDISHLIRLL